MDLFNLKGRNAVVVGGAGGIGQAIAQGLAEAGAKVAIASRSEESLKRAQSEIKAASGCDVSYYTVDASTKPAFRILSPPPSRTWARSTFSCARRASTKSSTRRISRWMCSVRC